MAGTWRAELAQKCESCLLHVGDSFLWESNNTDCTGVCPGSPRCLFTDTHGTHGTHGRTRAHFLFTGTVSLTSREVWSNGAFIPKQRSSCARMAREDTQPEPQRPGRSGEHSSETVDWLVAVTGGGKQ